MNATQVSRVKRKYTPRLPVSYTCGWCENQFLSSGTNSKFCSSSCRDKNRYSSNRESRLASVREYRKEGRASYLRHRDKRIEEAVRYQRENPEVVALTRARRRARESFKITRRDHRRLLERYRHSCAYCGIGLAPWGREVPNSLQWDHVLPLAKGGRDSVGNILPTCRSCNSAKSAKLLASWKRNI